MTSTRAQDEKHQKILRELLQEKANKRCFDCIQKGPVYANITIGTFVCTQCSGIHRELSHRVKSISMSTFTPQEIEKMKSIGNAEAEHKWRPNWNPSEYPLPDPSDTSYIRKFIYMTYEKKAFCSKEKKSKDSSSKKEKKPKRRKSVREGKDSNNNVKSAPVTEPLSSLLGNDIPSIQMSQQQQQSQQQTRKQDSLIDLFDSPTPSSTTTSPSSKSNPLGDLSSLYAQSNIYSSSGYGNTSNQNVVNPFSQNTSFGNTQVPQQQSKEIEQLTTMIRQLQEAISLRQQQITIGQQNYAQLSPDQKNQLLVMMQTQQSHQQKLIEATQQLNNMTSQKSTTTTTSSYNPFGQSIQQQQYQQQPNYSNNMSMDGLFSQSNTSSSWNSNVNSSSNLKYGNTQNYNFGSSNTSNQQVTDPFSSLTSNTSSSTDFNPFG